MSDDPFDDPAWLEYAQHARDNLEPMIKDSAVTMSFFDGKIEPRMALELGYMVLLDKPIIAVVTPGAEVPNRLAIVADEIVELALEDPSFPQRLQDAMTRVMAKREQEDKQ